MSEEEKLEKKRAAQRRWYEKQKQMKAMAAGAVTNTETKTELNYKKLYSDAMQEIELLNTKIQQLEDICKSCATKENEYKQILQRATIEYDAKLRYITDCIKHAYISTQFVLDNKGEVK